MILSSHGMELVERVCTACRASSSPARCSPRAPIDEVRGRADAGAALRRTRRRPQRRGGSRVAAHVLRLRIALLFGALRGDAGHVARVRRPRRCSSSRTAAACWATPDAAGRRHRRRAAPSPSSAARRSPWASRSRRSSAGVDDPLDPRRFAVFGLARATASPCDAGRRRTHPARRSSSLLAWRCARRSCGPTTACRSPSGSWARSSAS